MLASERQHHILRLLDERGTIRNLDLAEELNVTDETIRRDMQVLADNHQLVRTHGGATSLYGRPKLQSFTERRGLQVEQKAAIAKAAQAMIEPGQTYAFDSSTTTFELVRSLPDADYRVITNAYAVLDHLIRFDQTELISTGGRYQPKTQTFISSESYRVLQRHNINIAFVSCVGLDPKRGASEGFEEQAGFKEILVKYAEQVVLLVDSSKLNQRSEYFFAKLNQFSTIITDSDATPECVRALKDQGVEVIVAPTASN